MPRKRPANGTVQLNVWISVEAKQYLDERFEREGRHLYEQIEDYIRKDMAAHRGELMEQQSLPVISEIVDTTLRKYTAQLRADLRDDLRLDILEPMKTVSRNSDDRLASLIVRAVRDAGIIRRLLIMNTLGEMMVFDHIAYLKLLIGNQIVRGDERACLFAGKVFTLPLHFQIRSC